MGDKGLGYDIEGKFGMCVVEKRKEMVKMKLEKNMIERLKKIEGIEVDEVVE